MKTKFYVVVFLIVTLKVSEEAEISPISDLKGHKAQSSNPEVSVSGDGRLTKTEMDGCSVTIGIQGTEDPKAKEPKIEKGAPGSNGLQGPPGVKGERGIAGPPGPVGAQGEKGVKGEIGEKGEKGEYAIGKKGDTGAPGLKGDKGFMGDKGDKGEEGCCKRCSTGLTPSENDLKTPGTSSNPAQTCRDIEDVTTEETVFLNPVDPFTDIYCDIEHQQVCLRNIEPGQHYQYQNEGFWLSTKGFNITYFYNMKTLENIEYLKSISKYVDQVIRVYDKNICKISNYDVTKYIQLLLNTDVIIGPRPTEMTPLHYTYTNYSDCNTDADGAYIEIKNTFSLKHVPVLDFYIRGSTENSEFRIKNHVLCFHEK
ncbi:unnamed protein product [Leptidea sinapis]|uniref:Fibrillar collagen NC1 domain-containing protein n=1 Tax=Leptidea sinapis TaxID=189913 RepID=A0A5E4PQE0_9NEOP|nr:unnamed protein product [Leptidea sinapis]